MIYVELNDFPKQPWAIFLKSLSTLMYLAADPKIRLLKTQLKAFYVFKQLIANITFQTMVRLVGYSTDAYLRHIGFYWSYNLHKDSKIKWSTF